MTEYNPENPDVEEQDEVESDEEAPQAVVPAEPEAVTVAPADQSDVLTRTFHDKEYEVTPDRGHRLKR